MCSHHFDKKADSSPSTTGGIDENHEITQVQALMLVAPPLQGGVFVTPPLQRTPPCKGGATSIRACTCVRREAILTDSTPIASSTFLSQEKYWGAYNSDGGGLRWIRKRWRPYCQHSGISHKRSRVKEKSEGESECACLLLVISFLFGAPKEVARNTRRH
jgi:hypothetical protein